MQEQILQQLKTEVEIVATEYDLDQLKSKYLGKNSFVAQKMADMKNLSVDEKKVLGAQINELKQEIMSAINIRKDLLLELEINKQLAAESIDVSLPSNGTMIGRSHPISLVLKRIADIFTRIGFLVTDGPEIETDYFNFEALNIPKNHPARAMQDTFYTAGGNVLRTHTSSMEIRYAQQNKPPIQIISPGRVYRVEMDATHTPMFHQVEGLWIDQGITFSNLKATIEYFLQQFFKDDNLEVRFRASFFPFTEPSAEVDILLNGKWVEVLGCGMTNNKVLINMGIDPDKYSGFAFGLGVERLLMLRYQIDDIRLLYENHLEFNKQFLN